MFIQVANEVGQCNLYSINDRVSLRRFSHYIANGKTRYKRKTDSLCKIKWSCKWRNYWTGKMFASTKNKECREFRNLRWEEAQRKKQRTVRSSLCCESYSAPFIHSFLSSLAVDRGSRKSAEKAGFSKASFSRDKRVIPQNVLGAILLRKCFKDLANTQYVIDELSALYESYRTKCRRYVMRDEYAIFAFLLLRLSDIFIVLYISSYFIPSTIRKDKSSNETFGYIWSCKEKHL